VSSAPGVLELPAHLAAALQLSSGTEVVLQVLHPPLAAAAAVVVEPAGPADWEVVELNAGLLEEHVLGQVGVCGWCVVCDIRLVLVWW
jgi:antitoxin component of MazEF toxin-antitoxin module